MLNIAMTALDKSANNDFQTRLMRAITEVRAHYTDLYTKTVDLDNIENKALRDYLKKFSLYTRSHRNRLVSNVQIMKHTFLFHKTNNITACFKVISKTKNLSCIYGFLHSEYNPKIEPKIRMNTICTGPTFNSQDGEYRGRLILWKQFNTLWDKFSEQLEPIEALILSRLESDELSFQVDFYYPFDCPRNATFEDDINVMRLPVRMFVLCWWVDFYNIHFNIMENHIHPTYVAILYREEDELVFKNLLKKIKKDMYVQIISYIADHSGDPKPAIQKLSIGQKIFPITALESARIDDIHFNVWREIYINNMASNLILNLITPCFSFVNTWFYIQGAHKGLFDNPAMHDKYKHSDVAEEISNQLRAIDKLNYTDNVQKKKALISNKFFQLSRNIRRGIVYADSNIKLTDLAVCMTSEYFGRTLRDIPAMIINGDDVYGLSETFTNKAIFVKHIFEYVYTFYCMNSKIAIIHGDLHMNNVTIYRLYTSMQSSERPKAKISHIAYVIQNSAYVFEHLGTFSGIIDFSRAIIGDYKKIEREFGPGFAEGYFADQRLRALFAINHYFPDLMKKFQDKIESLLVNNFPLMFKIISVIDTFAIMKNIEVMFTIDEAFSRGKIKIAQGAIAFLTKLYTRASELFTENLKATMDGRITDPEDIEWPNLIILRECFSKYAVNNTMMKDNSIDVVEIFNSNNEVLCDVEDYATLGPLVSLDKELEILTKYDIKASDVDEWIAYKKFDETQAFAELSERYTQKEADVILEMEDWMYL